MLILSQLLIQLALDASTGFGRCFGWLISMPTWILLLLLGTTTWYEYLEYWFPLFRVQTPAFDLRKAIDDKGDFNWITNCESISWYTKKILLLCDGLRITHYLRTTTCSKKSWYTKGILLLCVGLRIMSLAWISNHPYTSEMPDGLSPYWGSLWHLYVPHGMLSVEPSYEDLS